MMKFERLPAPDFLTQNFTKWGTQFVNLRTRNLNAKFAWATYEQQKVNILLLPTLMAMTAKHCSFCDGFPVETVSSDSIEHFRPKSQFPLLAYAWENLFYCCSKCQQSKLEKFDENLLKPDDLDYNFEHYFQYDTKTGEIIPNSDRSEFDIERARITIELYGMNDHSRPTARKRTIRMYENSNNPILEDFPYRFLLQTLL